MAPKRKGTSQHVEAAVRGKGKAATANPDKVVLTESLRATEAERCATSRSLYGDSTARISSNVGAINDRIRLRAYEAIFRSVRGKTVLHLGCGIGLYAMLAARHLAKHVVAVDTSSIVQAAEEVARQNKLHNITFLRGRLCDVLTQLPERRFDVVLCEWMDAFVVNHHLLTDVLYARDHLLSEGGVVCPDHSSLHVVGVSDYAFRLDTIDFWSNVYGFTMHPMKRLVEREVEVCAIPPGNIATSTCLAYTATLSELPGLTPAECARYEGRDDTASGAMENPVEQRWVPSKVAQEGLEVPFTLIATTACTVHYLTFFVDASFTSPVDVGANFMIAIKPGGRNAWTEVSVGLQQALPLAAGETVTGTVKAFTPVEGGGKATVVRVTAKTQGRVAAIETSGEYVYQPY